MDGSEKTLHPDRLLDLGVVCESDVMGRLCYRNGKRSGNLMNGRDSLGL